MTWTPERDALVVEMRAAGSTYEEIAQRLDTSASAIAGRVYRQKLRPKANPESARAAWTPDELAGFTADWMRGASLSELMQKYGRSESAITRKRHDLGLPARTTEQPMRPWAEAEPARRCQWLRGEAKDRDFCGAPAVRGTSWCEAHFARVFLPAAREPARGGGVVTALVRYDAACRAVAEAKSVDEAKDIRDRAEAMRAYGKQAKNRQLEVDAAEIRFRAERRLGELIKAQRETVGLRGPQHHTGGGSKGSKREPLPDAPPTLADAGIDKKLSSRAQKLAAIPEDKFEGMLGEWRGRVEKENERVTTSLLREGEHAQRDETFAAKETAWPEGRYTVLYADPPWRYEHPPIGASNRSIENHYPTMTVEEICALPIPDLAAENAVLFLWATAPKLAECFKVIEAWGFTYRTCMVWVKDKIGMGYHARNRHEILLIAKRGQLAPPEPSNRPDSVVEAARQAHSAKPAAFYDLIERMYPDAPKVELFSRTPREGWAVWGYEAAA